MAHIRLVYARKGDTTHEPRVIICTELTIHSQAGEGIIYYTEPGKDNKVLYINSIRWYHICPDIYFT